MPPLTTTPFQQAEITNCEVRIVECGDCICHTSLQLFHAVASSLSVPSLTRSSNRVAKLAGPHLIFEHREARPATQWSDCHWAHLRQTVCGRNRAQHTRLDTMTDT